MKTYLAAVLAAALLWLASSPALASDADVMRQAKDRAEIEVLMWRYVRALDTLNADDYASVYTPDGQFGTGANASKGRDALKKMVTDIKKGREQREAKGEPKSPPMYHVIANSRLEFVDADHARLQSYWMTVFGGGPQSQPAPRVAAAGRGIDELVRLNGQWLIKSRDVAPQD
jgi:hypothetical protein